MSRIYCSIKQKVNPYVNLTEICLEWHFDCVPHLQRRKKTKKKKSNISATLLMFKRTVIYWHLSTFSIDIWPMSIFSYPASHKPLFYAAWIFKELEFHWVWLSYHLISNDIDEGTRISSPGNSCSETWSWFVNSSWLSQFYDGGFNLVRASSCTRFFYRVFMIPQCDSVYLVLSSLMTGWPARGQTVIFDRSFSTRCDYFSTP